MTGLAQLMRRCNKLLKAQTNPGEFMNFMKWKDNVHETTFSFSSCFPQSFLSCPQVSLPMTSDSAV